MWILMAAVLIFCAVAVEKMTSKVKLPMLLGFIVLGLFLGNGSFSTLRYDDYSLTETICSCALIIVMFYGGFGTNWKEAKSTAVSAGLLASFGVAISAFATAAFCVFVLGFAPLTGLLVGALVSSTDAASVFSILRSQNLSLKYHTDSLLEVESGSNDPMSYMLVLIVLTMMKGGMSASSVVAMLVVQIVVGFLTGWIVFFLGGLFLRRVDLEIAGFLTIFIFACALASYGLASVLGGNGYLAVFLILGLKKAPWRQSALVSFAGLRGAASIVFAIMAMVDQAEFGLDVFHLVFGVVLFSIVIQGSLLPWAARKLDMVDQSHSVFKTFNDYSEEGDLCFCEVKLDKTSRFANRTIAKLGLPPGLAVALVLRNGKRHVPDGDFVLRPLDTLIVTGTKFDSAGKLLDQERIDEGDERIGQPLSSLEGDVQRLVCIQRGASYIVPDGSTVLCGNDLLIFVKS